MNTTVSMILASASPRRKELLRYLVPHFEVMPADIDEETLPTTCSLFEQPLYLAEKKAAALATQHPDALILGCDTAVFASGLILGKPKSERDAFRMLRMLSGKTHTVVTGCCLQQNNRKRVFCETTAVTFYPLTDTEIDAYLATGEPFDKAGAYGIQGYGRCLVREIHGCYDNVVGLPVARLKRELEAFLSSIDVNF